MSTGQREFLFITRGGNKLLTQTGMLSLLNRIKSSGRELNGALAFLNNWSYFSHGKANFSHRHPVLLF